jgi:hypothetical protein
MLKSSSGAGVVSSGGETDEEQMHLSSSTSNKLYSNNDTPELLKSNRTTASSFIQNSQTHLQTEIEALEVLELTVKQHQQELLGEKALLTMGNIYNK